MKLLRRHIQEIAVGRWGDYHFQYWACDIRAVPQFHNLTGERIIYCRAIKSDFLNGTNQAPWSYKYFLKFMSRLRVVMNPKSRFDNLLKKYQAIENVANHDRNSVSKHQIIFFII